MKTLLSEAEFKRRKGLHKRFVADITAMRGQTIHLVAFQLGNEKFTIEIDKVNRVIVTPKITKLPKTPSYIRGVSQVGKSSIINIDLQEKLGLSDGTESVVNNNGYTIIVSSERFTIGVLVPEVPSNFKVNGDLIHATGLDLAGTPEDETYIKGLIHMDDSTLYFIDIDELIEGDRMEARSLINS
ncbi:chemotaxis protein CheW [Marinoscillum sp. MHG1-6]|uniref:chemotaxis protein CheW n=1 Tax=Marinoscillum sp. MHG1-6 TaxID=2959627 RepID=UPI0021573FAE|nr:chemotaxis protein CheW [Marinoscillum sp. MHG1-6]